MVRAMRQSGDLDTLVANRKRELIAEIIEHKKNSSRSGAAGAIDKIKQQLLELSHILKTDSTNRTAGRNLRLAEWVTR